MLKTRLTKIVPLLAMVCLLFVGGPLGFGLFPETEVPKITKEELKAKLGDRNLVLVDLFKPIADAARTRIIGALRERPADYKIWSKEFDKDKTLVLYCSCMHDEASIRIGQKLMQMGFRKVYALKGGWREWAKAGYPTEP